MDEREKNAWDICLPMWKAIAYGKKKPGIYEGINEFKERVLKDIDISESFLNACPMCEAYMDRKMKSCKECPISLETDSSYGACENYSSYEDDEEADPEDCNNEPLTPYGEWQRVFPDIECMSEKVYQYFVRLARKRGYYYDVE